MVVPRSVKYFYVLHRTIESIVNKTSGLVCETSIVRTKRIVQQRETNTLFPTIFKMTSLAALLACTIPIV